MKVSFRSCHLNTSGQYRYHRKRLEFTGNNAWCHAPHTLCTSLERLAYTFATLTCIWQVTQRSRVANGRDFHLRCTPKGQRFPAQVHNRVRNAGVIDITVNPTRWRHTAGTSPTHPPTDRRDVTFNCSGRVRPHQRALPRHSAAECQVLETYKLRSTRWWVRTSSTS